jgi:heme O synthase-like polyprenyltransferase
MSVTSDQQFTSPVDGFSEPSIGDFWALLKPRVMSLVIFTGFAGMYLAPGTLHPLVFCRVVICHCLRARARRVLSINGMIVTLMRSCHEQKPVPIPAGVMIPAEALTMGLVISALVGIATWACGELACGRSACFHNLLLCGCLHNLAKAKYTPEYCHWWCGWCFATRYRLGGGYWRHFN